MREGEIPPVKGVTLRSDVTREQMCGQWDVQRDQRLSMAGRDKNIVGYCYEDRSGGCRGRQ